MRRVCERQALHAEYMKREVYLGSEEGEGAPLDARCFNIPSAPPPPSQQCAQLCLAVAGPGCCIPGELLGFFKVLLRRTLHSAGL
ncbi:hypothetical protein KUCAC02_017667, partial [Chaenocephalus aceratus]